MKYMNKDTTYVVNHHKAEIREITTIPKPVAYVLQKSVLLLPTGYCNINIG